jgi:hypothetical protein
MSLRALFAKQSPLGWQNSVKRGIASLARFDCARLALAEFILSEAEGLSARCLLATTVLEVKSKKRAKPHADAKAGWYEAWH